MRSRLLHGLALTFVGLGLAALAHLADGNPWVAAYLYEAAGVFLFLGGIVLIGTLKGVR